jgi:KDO2-lipid IV(A) lauroyltransferase
MRTLLRLTSLLPLRMLYAVFAVIGALAFHLGWRRDIAAGNLALAFPALSSAERAAMLRRSYRNMADVLAEALWGYSARADALVQRVALDDAAAMVDELARGQPVILLAAHFCNWEWLLLSASAQLECPIDAVYKPQRMRSVDAFLLEARSRFGGRPIPHKRFVGEVLKQRHLPRAYAMVADQTPLAQDIKHWARFLGHETPFFLGPGRIARLLKAPVLYVSMHRVSRGRYRAALVPVAQPPYGKAAEAEIIERYAALLERDIGESPADWFWVHRKWKYGRPSDAHVAGRATKGRADPAAPRS